VDDSEAQLNKSSTSPLSPETINTVVCLTDWKKHSLIVSHCTRC